jgi:hypothetical protein
MHTDENSANDMNLNVELADFDDNAAIVSPADGREGSNSYIICIKYIFNI